jgi:hypothetical protein
MTLAAQNDAGAVADADSYLSQAAFETYSENRNRVLSAFSDEAIEAALRAATQYIDTISRWRGTRLGAGQSTEFPRAGLADWSSYAVTGVPKRVKDACAELAWASLAAGEELYVDLDRGGRVASESVGPISVSYFADAPAGKSYRAAMQLLKQYMRDASQAYPGFTGGAAGQADAGAAPTEMNPLFDIGMHANVGD